MNKELILASYDYDLPPNLIAKEPTLPKQNANLLVYERKTRKINHLKFGNLCEILPNCAIIFNDTKVVKARIFGKKLSGAKVELLLNSPTLDGFNVFIKGRVKLGDELLFSGDLKATITEICQDGSRCVKFSQNGASLSTNLVYEVFNKFGEIPLPPYIKRAVNQNDDEWYQSIFAKNLGAVAAPTASLHFDNDMLNLIKKNHEIYSLTLHVGAGTFKGVEADNILEHKIHSEFYEIPQNTANLIDSQTPILGVGTTTTRCVENYARNGIKNGKCELFLHPQNRPVRQNFLLTNFHLPKSSLIMLVASFIGLDETMRVYKEAVLIKYKFYSYGDAMLII